jgi:nucleoside-diphosphate-sugar epimerase
MPDFRRTTPTLVTGGTGFLGRRLVERLLGDGRSVTVLARNPAPDLEARGVRFICAPLDDTVKVQAACEGMGTVFHIAAKVGTWGRYRDFFRANVLGTRAVIDGCRKHGVLRLVHTSTPSVVYNGRDIGGGDESMPLTTQCPSPYALTKARAEYDVLAADSTALRTVALRPHLLSGSGDPHLVPRLLSAARAGRLRIVGSGENRVDITHVENAVDAHLLAETALHACDSGGNEKNAQSPGREAPGGARGCAGKAYFITNGEPVNLWQWINRLLAGLGLPPVTRRISLRRAAAAGSVAELAWRALPLAGEPPMTRFIAAELAKDHWFDISAARRDLGYTPRISLAQTTEDVISSSKVP